MAAQTNGWRLPLSEGSYSFSLSFILHGLLTLAVVYAPQWLHSAPFNLPVSYEVTLVSPKEADGRQKADPPVQAGPKVATATASVAAQPGDVLVLPPQPQSSVPATAGRPLSASMRAEDMTLPTRHRSPERQTVAPVTPPAPQKIVAPQLVSAPALSPPVSTPPGMTLANIGPGQGSHMAKETGVTVGNTDPALAYYFVLIQDKITSSWAPPKVSPGTTAGVSLSLKILRSGQVRDLVVWSSSGDRLLDDTAVRAVTLASPLPPLPPLFKAEALSLELRFTFVGEKS